MPNFGVFWLSFYSVLHTNYQYEHAQINPFTSTSMCWALYAYTIDYE